MTFCKKNWLLFVTAFALLCSGCGTLVPKKVEFGQRKIEAMPDRTPREIERLRQAAALAAGRAREAFVASEAAGVTGLIKKPAGEAAALSGAVSQSLGPPLRPASNATNTVRAVDRDTARLNARLEKFRSFIARWEGHKIEGSGRVQIGYFSWVGGILLLGVLAFVGIRLALSLAANSNPAIGAGVRVAGKLAGKALGQVVAGGEAFKNRIKQSGSVAMRPEEVLALFRQEQEKKQDEDSQETIKSVTRHMP